MPFGRIGIGRVDTAFIVFGLGVVDLDPAAIEPDLAKLAVKLPQKFIIER